MIPEPAKQHVQNVETIASLQARSEQQVNSHQRGIERITAVIGRPATVYVLALTVVVWIQFSDISRT